MKANLFYDLTTKALTDGSSAWAPPAAVFGESLIAGIRFNETIQGAQNEIYPTVSYLKAGSGLVDARPASDTWRLQVGSGAQTSANTTAALAYNIGAQGLQDALNALTAVTAIHGTAAVMALDGSYLIKFGSGAANVPLALVESQLNPPCFGQLNAWQAAGIWVAELRLVQAPVLFTDGTERVLPQAPSVVRIQAGYDDGAGVVLNEIQQLTISPDFRGSYQFRRNNIRTVMLSVNDAADAIQTALAKFGSGITATLLRDWTVRIEFGGDFAGQPQDLLGIVVADAPVGDLTFALSLDTPQLAAMLRTQDAVVLPLEIEIGLVDDTQASGIAVHKIRTSITIQRGVIFPMLATAAGINWLRPVPKDYIPFTADQIITGQQFYACALGNGAATEFTVDHNLDTGNIAAVLLRENSGLGRMLIEGTDYSVTFAGANSLTVTLLGSPTPPATAGLGLVITAAGPVAVFQAHTHTIEQVVGLSAALDSLTSRVHTLETYIPANPPSVAAAGPGLTITIPKSTEVLFYKKPVTDLSLLPVHAPFLLPMVAADVSGTISSPPNVTDNANCILGVSARFQVPGGGGIPSTYVETDQFVACDGRIAFPARQSGTSKSYHPIPFERTLWKIPVNEKQLAVKRTLDIQFAVAVQLVKASCEGQWVLVIEQGAIVDQSDPAPEGPNLQGITWSATPILSQRILLTGNQVIHPFGCRITRAVTGLTATRMLYNNWEAATGTTPDTANFVLRARLINFDTRNNVPNARGWLYLALGDAKTAATDIIATIS